MSILKALIGHPDACLITGVEDDPGGIGVRVFVGARYKGDYFLVSEPEAVEEARRAWGRGGHCFGDLDDLREVGILLKEKREPYDQ